MRTDLDTCKMLAAEAFGVTVADIEGRSRIGKVAKARKWAMALARKLGMSLPQAGRAFRRDHTTIRSNVAHVMADVRRDPAQGRLWARLCEDMDRLTGKPVFIRHSAAHGRFETCRTA